MVNYCVVPLCKNSSLSIGISFHRFPVNEMKKRAWIIKIRRDENHCKKVSKHMRVCSAHFKESDYRQVKSGRKFLKDEAEPSVFSFPSISNHKHLCLIPTKRPKEVKVESVSSAAVPIHKVDTNPVFLNNSLQKFVLINNTNVSTVGLGNKMATVVCPAASTFENTSQVPVTHTPTTLMLKRVPDSGSSAAIPVNKDTNHVFLDKYLQKIAMSNNANVSIVSLGNKMSTVVCPATSTFENTSQVPVTHTPTTLKLKLIPDVSTETSQSNISMLYVLQHNTQDTKVS